MTNQQRIHSDQNIVRQTLRLTLYFVIIHIISMLAMSVCRMILLLGNLPEEGLDSGHVVHSFLIGLQFDNLIACYVAFFPCLVAFIIMFSTIRRNNYQLLMQRTLTVVKWWFCVVYALILFVLVANARYFHFFDNHLNIFVTEWFGFAGETAGLIFGDTVNLIYLAIALIMIIAYIMLIRYVTKRINKWETVVAPKAKYICPSFIAVAVIALCFVGMRGSFQRYPLKIGFAYFCDKPLYNKLGVNPMFNIIKSIGFKNVNDLPELPVKLDDQGALEYVQGELKYTPADSKWPITRQTSHDSIMPVKPNLVLILMESMTSVNLEREYNGVPLTPYLRSLRDKSIYFSNCYSTGTHTNNGIVGTMYGYAPNFSNTAMTTSPDSYTGIPYWLKKNGYETLCFVTGDPNYDNMNEFWRNNSVSQIYSLNDYPKEMAVNCFGVQDDYLFAFGLEKLSEYSKADKPFMATFLTVSNHATFIVPDAFRDRGSADSEKMVAFADNALENFIETAKATEWGKNTIFLLVSDHGYPLGHLYEMPLSHNQILAYIYSDLVSPKVIDSPVSQMDIYPTILSLIGIDFENNCLGINALKEKRRYAMFVNDDHLGCSDGKFFYCYDIYTKKENLYRVGESSNLISEEPELLADMRNYASNMIYVNNLAIKKKWINPKK